MNKMSLQKSIQNFGIKQALKYMEKDPEENIPKLMDMVDKFAPDGGIPCKSTTFFCSA